MGICCSFEDSGYSDPGPIFRPSGDLDPEELRFLMEAIEYFGQFGHDRWLVNSSPKRRRAHYIKTKRHLNRYL
jgi:hypothetical protein